MEETNIEKIYRTIENFPQNTILKVYKKSPYIIFKWKTTTFRQYTGNIWKCIINTSTNICYAWALEKTWGDIPDNGVYKCNNVLQISWDRLGQSKEIKQMTKLKDIINELRILEL